MSVPTIHSYPQSFLTAKARIASRYSGNAIEVPETFVMGESNKSAEFLKRHPAGAVPAMDHDGLSLAESSAIAHYVAGLKTATTTGYNLLGHSIAESASITQWIAFAVGNLDVPCTAWVAPIWGYAPYNKVTTQLAQEKVKKSLATLDAYLLTRTFLSAERVTLADIVVVCSLIPFFTTVLSPEWRAPYKNVVRWYVTCMNQPQFKKVLGECILTAEEAKPKKEEKKAKEAKPAAPKAEKAVAALDEDEEEAKPKAKSELDLLPPTSFNLEEWKRVYSNNDTKPTAMDYFWKNYDASGYSIWRVDYKYNDELAKVFMSTNLVGGFYNRMERAKKYAFGSLCVLGEDNKNSIAGYFVIRGDKVPFEINDAPDYESYSFVKVDHNDAATRELIGDYFAWEATIEGKKHADGKVFK